MFYFRFSHINLLQESSLDMISTLIDAIGRTSNNHYNNYELDTGSGGYFNTTSAIDAIQFKFSSGDIDAGTIKLYGLKDS